MITKAMQFQKVSELGRGYLAPNDPDQRPYVTIRARAELREWARHEDNVEAALAEMRALAKPILVQMGPIGRVVAGVVNTAMDWADNTVQLNVQFIGISVAAATRIDSSAAVAMTTVFGRGARQITLE